MTKSFTSFAKWSAAVLTFSVVANAALAQTSCQTDEPSASIFIERTRLLYADTTVDSVTWVQQGLPFAQDTAIQLVTNDSICAIAVIAYNAASGLTDSPDSIANVYVAAIGSTGYFIRSGNSVPAGKLPVNYWFDSSWIFKRRSSG